MALIPDIKAKFVYEETICRHGTPKTNGLSERFYAKLLLNVPYNMKDIGIVKHITERLKGAREKVKNNINKTQGDKKEKRLDKKVKPLKYKKPFDSSSSQNLHETNLGKHEQVASYIREAWKHESYKLREIENERNR
ncbi:11067_t:CDS:2 [Entrophospora sp. SA101]|nr:11067_t:CDS:2 [Entrophospora sp. SA101]